MLKVFGGISRNCYRAVFFSFVQAPALALFVGFMFLSFNNSIADTFLSSARDLTANAPSDKVQLCVFKQEEHTPEPVHTDKASCVKTLTDASDWTKTVDANIRHIYFLIVILGFVTWFVFGGMSNQVVNKLSEIWRGDKR
ncbi:hypothetical protein [Erwinia amylovora]|uniref:hypothetical protein n=1 Tax=Erwinia amylovora TaxID=552 RepID=UPI0014443092|nr:hypothetical protein [Erwinia amylovora]